MDRSTLVEFLMRGSHRPVRSMAEKIVIMVGWLALFSALRWIATPLMVVPTPYSFYLPAVVLVTAMCGPRWGYATVVTSLALTIYLWLPPAFSLRFSKSSDVYDVLVWGVVSAFIVLTLSALDAAAERLARQARELAEKSQALEAQTTALEESRAKLRTYAIDLERLVAERTVKLTEALAELESFSYTVSHDLRSPLRAMQGFSHLALEESRSVLTPRTQDYLRRIDGAAQKMDELIRDLLLFTRAGHSAAVSERIDTAELLQDVIHRNPQWSELGSVFDLKRPLLTVRGARSSLAQSLTNLLDNAVKFVPAGRTAHVRIWTERRGSHVRLQIEDNGIGMHREFLSQIFKPFHRGHPDAEYAGRGIGLAVAKKNIVHMGGDIGVTTEPGTGATFWIELPGAEATV